MANTKISALASGVPAQTGDQLPIARAGANFSLTVDSIMSSGLPLGNASATSIAFSNIKVINDGANVLALKNSTQPQNFSVYGTFTDASNYERMLIQTNPIAGRVYFQYDKAGTGTARTIWMRNESGGEWLFTTNSNVSFQSTGFVGRCLVDITNAMFTSQANTGGFNWSDTGQKIIQGTGTPEGSKTAVVGSLYLRTDGGAATTLYVKETGTGNTGWVAK